MASNTKLLFLSFLALSSFVAFSVVTSFEFQVRDIEGWAVPPANDSKIYNDWASEKRFQVGDTIRFKYHKDSVMEVTEAEYMKCNSTHPHVFSNTGNTVFKLDHPGFFYFISGATGHCQRGQRMIIKVLSKEDSDSGTGGGGGSSSSGVSAVAVLSIWGLICQFTVSYILYIASF